MQYTLLLRFLLRWTTSKLVQGITDSCRTEERQLTSIGQHAKKNVTRVRVPYPDTTRYPAQHILHENKVT